MVSCQNYSSLQENNITGGHVSVLERAACRVSRCKVSLFITTTTAMWLCSKNVSWFFFYNLKHLELMFIIFGTQYLDTLPFSALTLLVGWQEGHPACKKLGVGLLVVMVWLELCTTYSTSCHHHFHYPLLH